MRATESAESSRPVNKEPSSTTRLSEPAACDISQAATHADACLFLELSGVHSHSKTGALSRRQMACKSGQRRFWSCCARLTLVLLAFTAWVPAKVSAQDVSPLSPQALYRQAYFTLDPGRLVRKQRADALAEDRLPPAFSCSSLQGPACLTSSSDDRASMTMALGLPPLPRLSFVEVDAGSDVPGHGLQLLQTRAWVSRCVTCGAAPELSAGCRSFRRCRRAQHPGARGHQGQAHPAEAQGRAVPGAADQGRFPAGALKLPSANARLLPAITTA